MPPQQGKTLLDFIDHILNFCAHCLFALLSKNREEASLPGNRS